MMPGSFHSALPLQQGLRGGARPGQRCPPQVHMRVCCRMRAYVVLSREAKSMSVRDSSRPNSYFGMLNWGRESVDLYFQVFFW